tara:strand:+ start:229 stop:849 length:621 start_codon:yes stop_codon:yes gene_type:complete
MSKDPNSAPSGKDKWQKKNFTEMPCTLNDKYSHEDIAVLDRIITGPEIQGVAISYSGDPKGKGDDTLRQIVKRHEISSENFNKKTQILSDHISVAKCNTKDAQKKADLTSLENKLAGYKFNFDQAGKNYWAAITSRLKSRIAQKEALQQIQNMSLNNSNGTQRNVSQTQRYRKSSQRLRNKNNESNNTNTQSNESDLSKWLDPKNL